MLKKFKVKNYKNFKDEIEIDFGRVAGYQFNKDCIINDTIGKMLVYGKNGTGKTNLGKAILDIYDILGNTIIFNNKSRSVLNGLAEKEEIDFVYEFYFDGKAVVFQYIKRTKAEIIREKLLIDEKLIFEMDYIKKRYNTEGFSRLDIDTLNVERFTKSFNENDSTITSLLRWILANSSIENTVLNRLVDYVEKMQYFNTDITESYKKVLNDKGNWATELFLDFMGADYSPIKNIVKSLQEFLNDMGIDCKLDCELLPNGEMELYFQFDGGRKIPFYENASTGTLSLVNLYWGLIYGMEDKTFIYIDEFDAFYHYELAEKLIEWIKKKYPKTQVIITTHNTNLMNNQLMRPDCLSILSSDGKLTALCDATERELREGHNLEKMYISGEFERYE